LKNKAITNQSETNLCSLSIVDFCCGTGCISLLLFALLSRTFANLRISGVDISEHAITLARDNLRHNVANGTLQQSAISSSLPEVRFNTGDIFSSALVDQKDSHQFDIMISNPPYISHHGYNEETSRSVRNWEPKLALVPESSVSLLQAGMNEDIFYHRLLVLYRKFRSKVLVMEVGDASQAARVATMAAKDKGSNKIEIWRDWPEQDSYLSEREELVIDRQHILFRGRGNARAVVLFSCDNSAPESQPGPLERVELSM